jgi:D-xylose transport system permease protein
MNWVLALVLAFVIGGAIGALIGFFVARIGVPSFVVTLGLFLGFQGLQLVMLGEGGIFRVDVPEVKSIMNENLPGWAGWAFLALMLVLSAAVSLWDRRRRARHDLANRPIELLIAKLAAFAVLGGVTVFLLNQNRSNGLLAIAGVPIVIPITVLILFIGTLVLDRTQFGRHLYAVGGNAEAARRAGIKVANIRITAFIICSMLAVVSGLFHVSRLGAVEATAGRQIVLNGVAAAVVGGVSLFGGRGRLVHAAIGAFVIVMIENGLGLLEFPAGVNLVVTGSVLILAATIDALSRKRGNGVRS